MDLFLNITLRQIFFQRLNLADPQTKHDYNKFFRNYASLLSIFYIEKKSIFADFAIYVILHTMSNYELYYTRWSCKM